MGELKCYALDAPFTSAMTDTFIDALKDCDGLIGVNPDSENDVLHILFQSVLSRNAAYKKLKKYGAEMVSAVAYVNI